MYYLESQLYLVDNAVFEAFYLFSIYLHEKTFKKYFKTSLVIWGHFHQPMSVMQKCAGTQNFSSKTAPNFISVEVTPNLILNCTLYAKAPLRSV